MLEPVLGRPRWESVDRCHHTLPHTTRSQTSLQGLLAQSRWREATDTGSSSSFVWPLFFIAEIETGSYVAQVSLYISYVAEGDSHLCPDFWSAGTTFWGWNLGSMPTH